MADEGESESKDSVDAVKERFSEAPEACTDESKGREELEKWLNKIMKIKISDGRTLIGSFLCTDKDRNIILGSCQEYVNYGGTEKEDPRILGLAMIPGNHIVSIDIDLDPPHPSACDSSPSIVLQ